MPGSTPYNTNGGTLTAGPMLSDLFGEAFELSWVKWAAESQESEAIEGKTIGLKLKAQNGIDLEVFCNLSTMR